MKPIKTKQLGQVWVANQGDLSAIGSTEEKAIEGVKDCLGTQPTALNPPETAGRAVPGLKKKIARFHRATIVRRIKL